jgi:hypothetical protein
LVASPLSHFWPPRSYATELLIESEYVKQAAFAVVYG